MFQFANHLHSLLVSDTTYGALLYFSLLHNTEIPLYPVSRVSTVNVYFFCVLYGMLYDKPFAMYICNCRLHHYHDSKEYRLVINAK